VFPRQRPADLLDLIMFRTLHVMAVLAALCLSGCQQSREVKTSSAIYQYSAGVATRWSSPENLNGVEGKGGMENNGGKGHAFDSIGPGQSRTLLDIKGTGRVNRMWITVIDRTPEMLRSLRLEMFWDNNPKPAVSVPFGDFFCVGLGRTTAFQNHFFANAEGRSFQSFIPMPFREGARIVVTNDSMKKLTHIFFDVDYQLEESWDERNLYFHSYWSRDTATTLGTDFQILPAVKGHGRFLGANVGINAKAVYKTSWWGEGEVKIFLDRDTEYPTLAGTGTEDYIGTGWGQGMYINNYAGCTIADAPNRQWSFYRLHVPDPVFFAESCRVDLQQIGGEVKTNVLEMQRAGAPLIPVTIDAVGKLSLLYEKGKAADLSDSTLPDGWTNFYRSDDLSATAYFYLDTPSSALPELQPVAYRTANLGSK
jgi:hypothetical protein